jgi:hypothetical protein
MNAPPSTGVETAPTITHPVRHIRGSPGQGPSAPHEGRSTQMRRVAGYLFGFMSQQAPKGVTPAS